jgi:hypothetical protein
MVQIHFECIKYCADGFQSNGNEMVAICWKECEKLGKEGCDSFE